MKPLAAIARPKLVHVSAQEAIRTFIVDNNLAAGDPLPGEMELARQLGVSRNTVREAVKALESVGIVEVRRGQGVFVRSFSFAPLIDSLAYGLLFELKEVAELLDIRCALETGMIARAMQTITAERLAAIGEIVRAMEAKASRGEAFLELDRSFHALLFEGLENDTLQKVLDVFWLAFQRASGHVNIADPNPRQTAANHAAILESVKSGDVDRVRQALDRHYADITVRLATAQEELARQREPAPPR